MIHFSFNAIFTIAGASTIHLKVVQVAAEPPPVFDHHVPVFTSEFSLKLDYWDLTTKQVYHGILDEFRV